MTLQVKNSFFKSTIDKLYSILNISRHYLKKGVKKCVEIKAHQVTNPPGMVINPVNFNFSFSPIDFYYSISVLMDC